VRTDETDSAVSKKTDGSETSDDIAAYRPAAAAAAVAYRPDAAVAYRPAAAAAAASVEAAWLVFSGRRHQRGEEGSCLCWAAQSCRSRQGRIPACKTGQFAWRQ